jgi:hypothetical protein
MQCNRPTVNVIALIVCDCMLLQENDIARHTAVYASPALTHFSLIDYTRFYLHVFNHLSAIGAVACLKHFAAILECSTLVLCCTGRTQVFSYHTFHQVATHCLRLVRVPTHCYMRSCAVESLRKVKAVGSTEA